MSMAYKTRGMSDPKGKPRVYFCCHPEDFEVYFEPISEEILNTQNCAIWYNTGGTLFYEEFQMELRQIQLFVMPITTKLLTTSNQALDEEFSFAIENHIPVLPILVESELDELFNQKCGDLQFLDRTIHASMLISYEEKLNKYLSMILIGDELASKVRAAFDTYIFLSYRKKDRKYIQEFMHLIHQNDCCRDVAIWYDEYLTPGENFNVGITDILQQSSLFALIVTPSLLENGNYVMCYEYPVAKKLGKLIFPVEMLPTDLNILRLKYPEIPDCICADDRVHLSMALSKLLSHVALRENDADLQHNFLIGLAYLSGIDVEVDYERAQQLITGVAEAGLPDAIRRLVDMYRTGTGVARDYHVAIQWQKRLASLYRTNYESEKNEKNSDLLISALWKLGDFCQEVGDLSSAITAYQQMQSVGLECMQFFSTPRIEQIIAVSYDNLGNIYQDEGNLSQAEEYYEKASDILNRLVEKNDTANIRQDMAINCDNIGSVFQAKGELLQARSHYEKAIELRRQLVKEFGTVELRQALSVSYNNLGYICNAIGDLSNAKTYYERGLLLRMQLAEEGRTTEAQMYLSGSHINLGDIYMAEGNPTQAKEHYNRSLEIRRQLVIKTETIEARQGLAVSYERLGSIYKREGELSQAETYFMESLELRRQLFEEIGTIDTQRSLSISYNNLGILYEIKGELPQAKIYYEKDLELSISLESQTGTLKDRQGLASSYKNMGDICQAEQESPQAKTYYQLSLKLHRQIITESEAVQARRDLAIVLCSLGIVYRDEMNFHQARMCYNEALALFRQMVKETGTVEARRDLAVGYSKLGGIYQAEGDISQARICCKKSLELRRLLADETKTAQAYDDLAASYFDTAMISSKKDSYAMAIQAYRLWDMLYKKNPENSAFVQKLKLVKRYFNI